MCMLTCGPPGGAILRNGHNLNNTGRSPLDEAACYISKALVL